MLAVVQQFERSPAELAECLQAFVQVVEVAPSAFSQHMNAVVPMMLAICRARDPLDDSVRQMAFEFLTSLISSKRTRACAKLPSFIREMVTLCMELMLELEDVEDWSEAYRDDGAPDASNYEVGEEGIDRVARALGPEAVLGHVFANVREYVNHADWKRKYVAMMTLSQCAETVQDEAHVDEIARLLVSLLSDGHPRVRFAALHAIGQTAADHTPYLQETHHELIMPALSRLMDDPVVKVAAHSCAAFLNFAEDLGKTELLPYVPQLMAKLCPKIISPARVAKEQAITAVAVIAGVIEEDFVPYYRQVMEVLKQVMLTATAREERALRGKAFECMSLLGMAVGRDVFKHDAREAMEAMMLIAGKGLDTDDPQKSYIQEAAQRICRALREDFLPYLPHLLPGVYATLQMQPSEVLDPDALDEEEDMTLSYLQSGKAVGLRTSQIEDFRSAVQMLACFLEVLGGHFFDHLQDAARCLLPALSFGFCDDVKREATQTWQELIGAAKAGLQLRGIRDDGALVSGLLRAYLQRTVEAMRSEEDTETLQAQAVGTGICIRAAGPGSMTEAEVGELCVQVRALLGEATERQVPVPERGPQGEQGWEEDDEAEAEEQREAEQMLRVKYAELLGALMEVHTRAFLSVGMQSVLPVVQEYLAAGRGASDRCLALYICGDMLEKLGQESVPVWPAFMQQALGAVADADAWVRQAAAYCVFHGARLEQFSPLAAPVAKALAQLLARPAARRDGREFAEAAVAALGQLCLHQAPSLRAADPDRLLGLFLDGLPIWEDADVASPSHEALLTLAQQGHPLLKQRASQVFRVLLEVYGSETSSDALNAGTRHAVLEAGEGLLQLQPPLPQKLLRRAQKIQRESKRKR
ncbi:unnamed protein product [Prorocentrum cordatum]|uniref:Importin-5 n=1 Tax=Prorocentrum cordatum TaxID=2364126 RepID=A0ABN9WD05_9DINO|nr:unnamed protein product [Polarella glacialis]